MSYKQDKKTKNKKNDVFSWNSLKSKFTNKKKEEFDILYNLLIGSKIKIIDSKNKNQIGISGILIFESENLFYIKIENKDEIKKIIKKDIIFEIEIENLNNENNKDNKNNKYKINGELFYNSIISRIKKLK